jgi:signal peptide peptidase SppA
MIDLPHVAARVFGTPLLIARGKLDVILGVLAPRLTGGTLSPRESDREPTEQRTMTAEGIALVSVVGTLVARSGYLDSSSGLLAYGAIGDAIEAAMADPLVRGVILDVDSPGGEVGGLFDLVARIAALRASAGKPLWAVANEDALSAAYAIASVADRIYVTQTGEVGSVGVVAAHVDESGADAQAGFAWSFIFAGQQKVDGNAHEPLSQRARGNIQADVDRLYGEFCTLIATNRELTVQAVRSTQAATYRGELAIQAGLADRLGTLDLATAEMAAELDAALAYTSPAPIVRRSTSMANESETEVSAAAPAVALTAADQQPAAAPTPGPAPSQQPTAPETDADPEHDPADALRSEYADIASLAAQAARLGVTVDAADAMRKGISAEALRRTVLDTLASRAEATTVIAAAPSVPSVTESAIVRRARERAAAARA